MVHSVSARAAPGGHRFFLPLFFVATLILFPYAKRATSFVRHFALSEALRSRFSVYAPTFTGAVLILAIALRFRPSLTHRAPRP